MFRAAFSLKIGEVMPYWPNNKHKSGYLVELRLSRACFWNWERKSWKKKHTQKNKKTKLGQWKWWKCWLWRWWKQEAKKIDYSFNNSRNTKQAATLFCREKFTLAKVCATIIFMRQVPGTRGTRELACTTSGQLSSTSSNRLTMGMIADDSWWHGMRLMNMGSPTIFNYIATFHHGFKPCLWLCQF